MRLLYLTRGCNIHDLRFLRAFVDHGWTAGFASLSQPTTGESVRALPHAVHDFGCLGLGPSPSTDELLAVAPVFQQRAAEFLPEIVLAGPVHDGAFVAANAGLQCRWIAQSWAFDVLWESERDANALRRARSALQTCQAVLADSRAVIRKCEVIAAGRINNRFLLPWGIDLVSTKPAKSRSTVRAEFGLEHQTVFLCTRRLEPVYRIDILLEAFRTLRAAGHNVVLLLASDGSLKPGFEAWIFGNELTDSIKLLGALEHHHLLDLFASADFYVSSAESDGTSVAMLEAMYLGVIPIVSDVGGNPEWVQHRTNGWLAQSGNAADFARAMNEALRMSETHRHDVTKRNHDLICTRADWALNIGRLLPDLMQFSGLSSAGQSVHAVPSQPEVVQLREEEGP